MELLVSRPGGESWNIGLVVALVVGVVAAGAVVVLGPVAALVIAIGALVVCAAVAMPGFLFGLFLLIPFYKTIVQPHIPIDVTVVLAVANALQIIPVVLNGPRRGFSTIGVSLWVALGGLLLAGAIVSPSPSQALTVALTFWALVLLPVLAGSLRVSSDPRYVRQFALTCFGMGTLTVVAGLLELQSFDRLRVLGQNTIQVSLTAFLVPVVAVPLIIYETRSWVRTVLIVLIPAAFVVALASGSRGPLSAVVVLSIAGAIVGLSRIRKIDGRLVIGLSGAIAATVVVLSLVSAFLPALSTRRFALFGDFVQGVLAGDSLDASDDSSARSRVRLLSVAWTMFTDHPLLGTGPAGFQVLSPRYIGSNLADRYPHNSLLQFAVELGVIGLVLFLGLVWLGLTRKVPRGGAWLAVRVLFGYLLVISLLSGNIFEDRMLWGLLLLLLVVDTASQGDGSEAPTVAFGPSTDPPPTVPGPGTVAAAPRAGP